MAEFQFEKVGQPADFPKGEGRTVEISGGRLMAVFNVDGKLTAIDGGCPHRGGPLGEGSLEGAKVTCPWHAWQFDVTTGVCDLGEHVKVGIYPVEVRADGVYVGVPEGYGGPG